MTTSDGQTYEYSLTIHTFGYFKDGGRGFECLDDPPSYVIDTRFLPAPYKIKVLSKLDGTADEVVAHMNRDGTYGKFFTRELANLTGLMRWWRDRGREVPEVDPIPDNHIAIGSSWGRHRSVAMAIQLAEDLRRKFGDDTLITVVHKHLGMKDEELDPVD